jgi:hypothetical protein
MVVYAVDAGRILSPEALTAHMVRRIWPVSYETGYATKRESRMERNHE